MKMPRHKPCPFWLKIFIVVGTLVFALMAFLWFGWPRAVSSEGRIYGITWSPPYARYLGISSEEGLRAAVKELEVDHVRFSTEWSSIEPNRGQFQWADLDRHLDILAEAHVPVTLAIGFKTPRWPECSHPTWSSHLSLAEREVALQQYLTALIRHVQTRREIVAWQVENEPFFPFGTCEPRNLQDIRNEYALVRALDPYEPYHRVITVTDSGEQGTWLPPGEAVDAIGFSVYRVTDNPYFGVRTYDWLPPWWYVHKMQLLRLFTKKHYYVSELQMEPWLLQDLKTAPVEMMFKTFSIARMRVNIWELQHLNFSHVDLWGTEWWYWMKVQKQHPEFWEEAKKVFQSNS